MAWGFRDSKRHPSQEGMDMDGLLPIAETVKTHENGDTARLIGRRLPSIGGV